MAENRIPDASADQQLVGDGKVAATDLTTGDSTPLQNVLTHLENEAPSTPAVPLSTTPKPGVPTPEVPQPGDDDREVTGIVTSLP